MPAVKPGSLVLVTGASGFIAAHLCDVLLENGYKVRGTVRSADKGEYLADLFKGKGHFEYTIVEDIEDEASFDASVEGVDGIAHTASPFHFNAVEPSELIGPAVKGTLGVLKSALKHNPKLQRVVVTSSVASVMAPSPSSSRKGRAMETAEHPKGPFTFTEADWNDYSPDVVEKEGKDAPAGDKYRASKVLAEEAAWNFVKENHPAWDLSTINPPFVLGPIIHQCETPEKLNTSAAGLWAFATGNKTDEDLKVSSGNWVDVRDVAEAHFKALTVDKAGGNRYIVSAGAYNGQEVVDIIHAFPVDPIPQGPFGTKGAGPEINKTANVFDGSKATRDLGINYISLEKCVTDGVASISARFGKK